MVVEDVVLLLKEDIFPIDCREGNKNVLLVSLQFVILILSRLLS